MRRLLLLLPMIVALTAGCGRSAYDDVEPVEIVRFDRDVANYDRLDSAGRAAFRNRYRDVVDVMQGLTLIDGMPRDTDELLKFYPRSRGMRVFEPDVADSLPDLNSAEMSLGLGFKRLGEWVPGFAVPRVYGVVSTYNQAVLTTDSAVFVALNHFLGEDYPGYSYFERYQRRMKRRELIAPMTLEAVIASRYPYRWSSDATLTSRMVYDGALTLATAQLLADSETTEDELLCMLLGWTTEQWQWAKANEGEAWKAMIDRDMVYSVDRTLADRMTKPSPVTAVLHPDAPGRLGTYIGVQIARSWLARHAGTTPIELLDSECYNAGSLLVESKYAPAAGRR